MFAASSLSRPFDSGADAADAWTWPTISPSKIRRSFVCGSAIGSWASSSTRRAGSRGPGPGRSARGRRHRRPRWLFHRRHRKRGPDHSAAQSGSPRHTQRDWARGGISGSRVRPSSGGKMQPECQPVEMDRLRQCVEAETGMDLAGSRAFPPLTGAVQRMPGPTARRQAGPIAGAFRRTRCLPRKSHGRADRRRIVFLPEREPLPGTAQTRGSRKCMRSNNPQREIARLDAGCATGEEPFSVAILLDQLLADGGAWQVSILGTDLNLAFLNALAWQAIRQWSFGRPPSMRIPPTFPSTTTFSRWSRECAGACSFWLSQPGEGRLSFRADRDAGAGPRSCFATWRFIQARGHQGDHRAFRRAYAGRLAAPG